jgi:hypothetical protein
MIKPYILIPQALPSVFNDARNEENWLIFAIGKADPVTGKRAKRPVVRDRPYIWTDRAKAAGFTYDGAVERLKAFRDWDGGLKAINEKAEKRRTDALEGGKKLPEIEVESYVLGYFAREDSALVALDFDNSVAGRVVEDFELGAIIEGSKAYIEISSSGTGLRVMMPRGFGDSEWPTGEKNDVGLLGSDRGAAFALTFDTLNHGSERDDELVDLALLRRGAGTDRRADNDGEDVADMVLEHGRIEVATFIDEIIPLIKNDDRFDGFNEWLGMVRGAKEYYEIVDPDGLDDVREAIEDWCQTWDGAHDADKFADVWDRKGRASGKSSLGSWVFYARLEGWGAPIADEVADDEDEVDEWAFLDRLDTEKIGAGKTKITRAIYNYMNCVRVMRHKPAFKGLIGHNVLNGGIVRLRKWTGEPLDFAEEWNDRDMHRSLQDVQGARKSGSALFSHFGIEGLKSGIEGAAADVQPITRSIEALPKWDGRPRLDSWLTRYFGVEDTPLHRAYARKFMVGLIARGHAKPGFYVKLDTVLVPVGMQGLQKSEFFTILAGSPSFFTDHVGEISKKEARENISGRWIVELSEGEVVTRADRRALKGFLTAKADKFRPAYARNVQTFPRACVFVMPTNEDGVLNDPTGSRRFWPVKVHKEADLGQLRAERGLMLAEALAAYRSGEQWWLTKDEDIERARLAEGYEIEDPIEDEVAAALIDIPVGQIIMQSELLKALDFPTTANSQVAVRVRDVLGKFGWERAKSGPKRGYRRKGWDSMPPMSDRAKAAIEEGVVIPLRAKSEFEDLDKADKIE